MYYVFYPLNCFLSYFRVDCHRTWFMTQQVYILHPCTLLSFAFVYFVVACVLEKIILAVFLLASIFFGSLLGCFPTWITSDLHYFLFTSLQFSSQFFACVLVALFRRVFFVLAFVLPPCFSVRQFIACLSWCEKFVVYCEGRTLTLSMWEQSTEDNIWTTEDKRNR